MDNQSSKREGDDGLRGNAWLNGVVILALAVAGFYHGIHAWDGGSRLAGALAVLDIACIYLLSPNVVRAWRKK